MKINNITNINFKNNKLAKDENSANAILMLRDPNASIKFQQSQEYAKRADSIDSNPIVSLGYKLYRTFNIIKKESSKAENNQFNKIA
ncbi:hypothetical protein IKB17_03190 [bacterium]|nr:hypothetical protein [bacterium]